MTTKRISTLATATTLAGGYGALVELPGDSTARFALMPLLAQQTALEAVYVRGGVAGEVSRSVASRWAGLNLVTDWGVACDGSANDAPGLAALAAGSYLVPAAGTVTIGSDANLPTGVNLFLPPGATLQRTASHVLTVNGVLFHASGIVTAGSVVTGTGTVVDILKPDASAVAAPGSASNYTPTSATALGHFSGINTAFAGRQVASGTLDTLAAMGGTRAAAVSAATTYAQALLAATDAASASSATGLQVGSALLSALTALASGGLVARTGSGTVAARTLTAGSGKVSVSNGDGVAGDPTVDVVESALTVSNMGGVLGFAHGGAVQPTAVKTSAYTAAVGELVRTDTTSAPFAVTLVAAPADGALIEIEDTTGVWGTNNLSVARGGSDTINGGTSNLVLTGGRRVNFRYRSATTDWRSAEIPTSGGYLRPSAIGAAVQAWDADLDALAALSSSAGLVARTGAGAFTQRSLAAGSSKVAVTNADGSGGNPTVDVTEANLTLSNMGGTLGTAHGGTGAATAGAARVNINQGTFALTDASTVAVDLSASNFLTLTIAGNRTMGAPSNVVAGGTWMLEVKQDGTGSRTLTWNAAYDWGAAAAPTLTTTAGKVDVFQLWSPDGTKVRIAILKGYS
jgi:hypothetical protein